MHAQPIATESSPSVLLPHSIADPTCVTVSARLLHEGANINLVPYLTQQVVSRSNETSSLLWMPFDSTSLLNRDRPTEWVNYRFCLQNDMPYKSSFALCLDGLSIEGFQAWSIHSSADERTALPVGQLPAGIGQTAVRIDLGPAERVFVEYKLRGRVAHSLTALRQYYVNHDQQSSGRRMWMLAYLSAGLMLLVLVVGLSMILFNRTSVFLAAYAVCFSISALFYSGICTSWFAPYVVLNDQTLSVVLAHLTMLTGLAVARVLLANGGFRFSDQRRFTLGRNVISLLLIVSVLEFLVGAQLSWVHPLPQLFAYRDYLTVISFGVTIVVGAPAVIYSWRTNYAPGKWLLVSLICTLVLGSVPVGYVLGWGFTRSDAAFYIMAAPLVQFLFFSLAIGSRFKLRQQKELDFLALNQQLLSEQKATLEINVKERTAELESLTNQLVEQNQQLQLTNRDMTESLRYAERIQRALLPSENTFRPHFSDFFVYYQPRDIVSGDFFWVHESKSNVVVAVADCTGHGVPGAFLSMISADLLRQIVVERGVTNPAEVLLLLDIGVRDMLHQESEVLDGLDISLCCFDLESDELYFAGANQSILLGYTHDTAREIRGTRRTIGERRKPGQTTQPFAAHSFDMAKLNAVYLYTDGVLDQFGGELGRKLGKQRFFSLVNSLKSLPMAEQRPALERGLKAWQGTRKQVDDHLVIGLRTH